MAIYVMNHVGYPFVEFFFTGPPVVERYKLEAARELPTYFKEWRGTKGWTQQQLADEMKTSKQTVSRIESGAREWGKGYMEAFGHVIGCHPLAPLLSAPHSDIDVSEVLRALGAIGQFSPESLASAAETLRSLVRASAPALNPAAKALPPSKQKETP